MSVIPTNTISLWGAMSAGPTGLSRAMDMDCAIVKCDDSAVSFFVSNVSMFSENRAALNALLFEIKRRCHQGKEDLRGPLEGMAHHLKSIEKGGFASSVASVCAGRGLDLFRYESIREEQIAAYQRLRSEICSQLYRIIMGQTRTLPPGALSQLIREAVVKRDEKAAKFLPALAGFYPRRFSRQHYQFMVDGVVEMPDGMAAKNYVNLAVASLRRYFDLEPVSPSIRP